MDHLFTDVLDHFPRNVNTRYMLAQPNVGVHRIRRPTTARRGDCPMDRVSFGVFGEEGTGSLTDISWNALRTINGSQRDGFEELCVQLASLESPRDAYSNRPGSPDGGVEFYCVLPNGDEWGWQAKFFLERLEKDQWRQLDRSVKRALDAHTNLKRYFVCVPRNRSDGRGPGITTELDRWNKRVDQWSEWAAERDMDVEFVWWGSTELIGLLSEESRAGLSAYWFSDQQRFSQDWFGNRLDEALESVGPRYTPKVHIEVSVAEQLRLFGRDGETLGFVRANAKDVEDAFRLLRPRQGRDGGLDEQVGFTTLAEVGASIHALFRQLNAAPDKDFMIAPLIEAVDDALDRLDDSLSIVSKFESSSKSVAEAASDDQQNRPNPFDERRSILNNLHRALRIARANLKRANPLVNGALLILDGEAGTGKTHLLCDFARERVSSGMPTILLTGQRFQSRDVPWVQALQQLNLADLDAERFLGGLQAAAQTANARALLIVDAINEGEGPAIWPPHIASFLMQVRRYPWIACVLSIRSIYEEIVIPEHVRVTAIKVTHRGFVGRSYDAARAYFEHYGLVLPSTPLLQPEFDNPLFLKLFCQGLRGKGVQQLPRGQYGISEAFDGLIEDVNKRLSRQLNYNPDDRPVHEALSMLAAAFAQQRTRWIPQRDAAEIANALVPSTGFSDSFYRALVSEGLLLENPNFLDPKRPGKIVSIAFERFADHLIADHLIDSNVDSDDPASAFRSAGGLQFLVDENNFSWRGVLEALCIQIPERYGVELPQLQPTLFESRWQCSAFLTSLRWRSSDVRTDDERHQFIELLRRGNGVTRDEVFGTLLQVATAPDHPLNADFLHEFLQRWSMPDRDARWSIYLHEAYANGEGGPVDRLLDWTNDPSIEVRDALDGDVVDLAATALAWMFSTSNRFVRDRATKGVVWLLTGRIAATGRLVKRFREVDDPYVVERVYAAAYGVATRCHDPRELEELATIVYQSVFAGAEPTPHILLRDYAKGVVERALHLGADIDVDASLLRPPYHSQWPDVPSDEELSQLSPRPELADIKPFDPIRAEELIHFSVMDWDFARYIIGAERSRGPWLASRLQAEPSRSPEEQMVELERALPDPAARALQAYRVAKREEPLRISFLASGDDETISSADAFYVPDRDITNEEYESAVEASERAYHRFLDMLGPRDHERYLAIEQALEGKDKWLDLKLIQRYVLWRVFDLGWSVERFGRFDVRVNDERWRESSKPERIGKKYQWIAYHEILAYIADHFQFDSGYTDDSSRHDYCGPWQLNTRDIDPTATTRLQSRASVTRKQKEQWWQGPAFVNWRQDTADHEWLVEEDGLLELTDSLRVKSSSDDPMWLNLRALRTWRAPSLAEIGEEAKGRREVWLHANAYLVNVEQAEAFYQWAMEVDFLGRWMPEPRDEIDTFLGEHVWAPAFMAGIGVNAEDPIPVEHESRICPTDVRITASAYLSEANGYDCSVEQSHSFLVPYPLLVRGMELRWLGNSADFFDSEGSLAAFDPDPTGSDASLLVREDLLAQFLEGQRLALVWTVLGEKMTVGGRSGSDWTGSLHITGAFRYIPDANDDDRISGDLRFRQRFPGALDA